jgi:arabinogalactan endo-1,4-beta-galactosidase
MKIQALLIASLAALGFGCGSSGSTANPPPASTGGATGSGGAATGAGGDTTTGTGGAPSTGAGGDTSGAGGATTTGAGGATTGAGGATTGTGGTTNVDAGAPDVPATPMFTGTYHMGADISWVPHDEFYGATYVDTDGVQKDILALLKNHGFNSVRLRTFVDPKATDGYDQRDGFADQEHTIAMGLRVKQAGMGLLLAIHYSDNWADPGKQCIPVAWQGHTIAQLMQDVHDYTFNLITAMKNAGAMPDLVQVGNEITPGLLFSICDVNGLPVSTAPINGRNTTANVANFTGLLKQGIAAVKAVDSRIKTVLHIDKGGDMNASISWINTVMGQGVTFDVFADTSYVRWQGQPAGWQTTFTKLATMYPNLQFLIPEYGNETATNPATPTTMEIANNLIFGISGNRGVGTWFYEPEHPAQAGIGIGLFQTTPIDGGIQDPWPVFPALPSGMAVYDRLKVTYAGRL